MSATLDAAAGSAVLSLKNLADQVKGDEGMIYLALADAVQALADHNMRAFDQALKDARSYSR